jgi:hypothetical protein
VKSLVQFGDLATAFAVTTRLAAIDAAYSYRSVVCGSWAVDERFVELVYKRHQYDRTQSQGFWSRVLSDAEDDTQTYPGYPEWGTDIVT